MSAILDFLYCILIVDVGRIGFCGQESHILKKTRIISVGLSCYNVEINNLFVLLIHHVPEILHLMTFHDMGQQPSWMLTSKPENNHIRGFAMQQFVEYDSSIVLLSHLTPAILLFMFFSKLRTCANLIFKVRMIPQKITISVCLSC